ncbi:MAG: HAD-IIB family hydrolase [Clostridia bacterium]|nr:HAD-IIB family hydrolase [Clostridia bacterium]
MGIFSGFLICSDIDGTFSVDTKPVEKNMEAVRYFTKNGGKFTIATGRTAAYLKNTDFFGLINAPACICNGSVVYDYGNDKILFEEKEEFTLGEFLNAIGDKRELLSGLYVYYTPKTVQADNTARKDFSKEELSSYPIKVVCVTDTIQSMEEFKSFCLKSPAFSNTYISNSWETGLEFNSKNGTKGNAVKFLKEYLKDIHTSIAIGDQENDIPMIEAADIGVCVADGKDGAKNKAKLIVCRACDGSVADLIRILEEKILSGEITN